jgi:hypothetical protein
MSGGEAIYRTLVKALGHPLRLRILEEQLPVVMRRGMARRLFRQIFSEASDAGRTGGFDESGAVIARLPLELDEQGWQELSELLADSLRRAEELERRSRARGPAAQPTCGPLRPSELAILHFRVAVPNGDATSASAPRARVPRPPLQ